MQITIRPLDLASDQEIEQYRAVTAAAEDHAYGGHEVITVDQARSTMADTPYWTQRRWIALAEQMEGGESVVGVGSVMLPLAENLDTIHVGLTVHPAFRGHGIATALIEQALQPAIEDSGRILVSAWGEIPAEGDVDDPALPANRIARRLGIERRTVGVCRILPLPIEDSLLDELETEAHQKLGEYRIEQWEGPIPEEHIERYGALLRQLDIDDPDEDIEHEPADYTPERIRLIVQRQIDAGVLPVAAVAIAPDGSLAGNSEIHLQKTAGTTIAWQENTLVMPEHRGHRLGMALKVATHRRLRALAPEVRSLITFNSHVNPWMISINDRLGYRVAMREIGYQGRPGLG